MSRREFKRLEGVERVRLGLLTNEEAARAVGISGRQMRRVRARAARLGPKGVIHGNRGRSPRHRIAEAVRARVVELRREKYRGFNDQHFSEKLAEVEGVELARASVQRILRAAGIGAEHKRRAPRQRRRRERKPQAGMMVLWDGSTHPWLEGRGPQLCLMAAMDDATGELLPGAHFMEQECAAGYLQLVAAMAAHKGLPWSIYMDHHGSLVRNDDHWSAGELQRGRQNPTQVGRVLEELNIEVIAALTPQAKGRVERLWRTLQDRLVSELRLVGACTKATANLLLKEFIGPFNHRFSVAAADEHQAWRQVDQSIDLQRVCSFSYATKVLNDNTVRLQKTVIDIAPGTRRSYARCPVTVNQLLDGSWRVYYREQLIATAVANSGHELRALKGTNKLRYRVEREAAAVRTGI